MLVVMPQLPKEGKPFTVVCPTSGVVRFQDIHTSFQTAVVAHRPRVAIRRPTTRQIAQIARLIVLRRVVVVIQERVMGRYQHHRQSRQQYSVVWHQRRVVRFGVQMADRVECRRVLKGVGIITGRVHRQRTAITRSLLRVGVRGVVRHSRGAAIGRLPVRGLAITGHGNV